MDVPSYNDLESHTNQKYSQFTEEKEQANINSQQQYHNQIQSQPVSQAPIQTPTQNPNVQNYQPPVHNPNMQTYQPPTQMYQPPIQTPYQVPVQTPYQVPIQTPYQVPVQTPYQVPIQTPYQVPVQTPYQVPIQTPYQPVYQPVMQQTSTNNVIVIQQNASPVVVERETISDDYPKLQYRKALAVLILNIFLPGIGTMVMGCSSPNAGSWICIGICQLLLTYLIIGWVWSIITGVMCLSKARQ